MTEQVISIKLTADGAELFETLNAAGNAIARLGQSADGLSQATNSLGDLAGSASGLNALTDAAGRLADATRSFADANREAAQSNDAFASASSVFQSIISGSTEALVGYLLQTSALSAGQGALTSATTGLGDAFKSTTIIVPKLVELSQSQSQAMTGQGAAASSTSSQVQKMSVAYEALTIVLGGLDSSQAAPAIKEIGSASDGTGSKAGSLASFFGGPWGIAIGLGVSVLAPLVGQIFDSGEAAKEAEAKADQYSQSLREMAISARDATRSLEGLARARAAEEAGKVSKLDADAKKADDEYQEKYNRYQFLRNIKGRSVKQFDRGVRRAAELEFAGKTPTVFGMTAGNIGTDLMIAYKKRRQARANRDNQVLIANSEQTRLAQTVAANSGTPEKDVRRRYDNERDTVADRYTGLRRLLTAAEQKRQQEEFDGIERNEAREIEAINAVHAARSRGGKRRFGPAYKSAREFEGSSIPAPANVEGRVRLKNPAQSLADALKEAQAQAEKLLAPLSKIPDDIVKTDEATEKLAQKFAKVQEIVAKGKFGKDEAVAAKTEIEQLREALAGVAEIKKLPFTQAMEDLQRQVETGKLLIAGKKGEVDAEEKVRSLMKAVGAERRDQLALVLRARGVTSDEVRVYFQQLGVLRQQTSELKKQEEAQAKLAKSRDELKGNLRQGVKDLFDGKGLDAIKGVFNRLFERVQEQLTDQLTDQIFGKLFPEQQPDLPGVTAINTAGEQIAQELAAVSTQTTNVKTGLENLVIGLDNTLAALDKIAAGPEVPTNDKLPDGQVPIYGKTSTELQLPRSNDKIPAPSLPHIKTLSEKLASGVQTALQGAAKGQAASGVLKSFGIQQSKLGSQIGGAIGNAILPGIGGFIGGALGGTIGALFKKAKTGSSAVISQDGGYGAGKAVGNSGAFKDQAKGLSGAVGDSLQQIASQLGGLATGNISVSLGVRDGKPVVDTTGKNRTKGAGVEKFGKGEESKAVAFAIADALSDGAIAGLSDKVKAALTSSKDIDRALREAIKVDEIEQLLSGFGGAAKKSFVDFERQAKERLRIAGKYGFDLVKLEAENAKQRKTLLDQSIESVTGGLKKLLDDLISGEKAPGTLLDRRDSLLTKKAELEKTAPTDAGDAQKLAEVLDQLYQVSLDAFGTAGAQFAADRSGIKSTAEAIIAQATSDLTAAQETARKNAGTDQASTDALLAQSNGHLSGINTGMDEANDKLAQIERGIARLENTFLGNIGGGSFVNYNELADIGRIAR